MPKIKKHRLEHGTFLREFIFICLDSGGESPAPRHSIAGKRLCVKGGMMYDKQRYA
jgi:hypothetical protein